MKYSKGGEASCSSFLSLPTELVLICLALVSSSHYPKLSLVSKRFQSLIFSRDLAHERFYLKTRENCVFLCLKLPTCYHPFWFSLYRTKNSGNLLVPVPVPSSYTPYLPILSMIIGSQCYLFDGGTSTDRSSVFNFSNKLKKHKYWRMTPSMKVARTNILLKVVLHDKIYVMGGCDPEESTHWAEVFDIKTQTWESLPDPGLELRSSSLRRLISSDGKLYVITTDKKHYVYDPEQGIWDVTETWLSHSMCVIDHVWYCFRDKKCYWNDSKLQVWNEVKGLDMLDTYDKKDCIVMAKFGEKLITFWDSPNDGNLCAVITLERRQGEVWGQIESVDVLKLPDSSILIRCVVGSI